MRPIFTIVLFTLCSLVVLGQDTSKAEIFAGYSYGNYELFSAPPSILTSNTTTTVSSTSSARLGMSGWNSSAAVKINRWFSFETDFSGYYSSSSAAATTTETVTVSGCPSCRTQTSTSVNTFSPPKIHNFIFGPQVSYPTGKVRPFAQFLVGGEHVDTTRTIEIIGLGGLTLPTIVQSQQVAQTGFAMAAGGGVDFSIRHNLAWRLQADYLTSAAGLAQNHVRVSTGIVWRLGG